MMQKSHGDDFARVRAFGQKGDKGCDGYLKSTGTVFQCYGALNGSKDKVGTLIKKMEGDFAKAQEKLGSIMKSWRMVHNLVDGLPIEAVESLNALESKNPDLEFGFFGPESFQQEIEFLSDAKRTELLGPVATNQDAIEIQVSELKDLINGIIEIANNDNPDHNNICPVPVDKLDANALPNYWKSMIASGWQNAHVVSDYLGNHHDPLIGEIIAHHFNERYRYLKAQHLAPEVIMDTIFLDVIGVGSSSPKRMVAAQALLSYLFESCDIFEDPSVGINS